VAHKVAAAGLCRYSVHRCGCTSLSTTMSSPTVPDTALVPRPARRAHPADGLDVTPAELGEPLAEYRLRALAVTLVDHGVAARRDREGSARVAGFVERARPLAEPRRPDVVRERDAVL